MADGSDAVPALGARFKWTTDQQQALHLLGGTARHTMLYGGSRSGKTFLLVCAVILRALKAPGSRHVIFRHRFNHLKTSVGFDTMPKAFALRFPGVQWKLDRTDWVTRRNSCRAKNGGLSKCPEHRQSCRCR